MGDRMVRLAAMRRIGALVFAVLVVAACETAPPRPRYPDISYVHLSKIRLDVARIDVVREYVSPGHPPNVEHLFPLRPADVAERWARDRLEAGGADGSARVAIKQASVVEVPLPRTGGIQGAFTTEQSERYDGVIEMSLEVARPSDGRRGEVSSRASRSRSVPENASLNDREKVWFEMTEAMMNDVNGSLERQIREHLGAFVR
jgi:hypothetical protein